MKMNETIPLVFVGEKVTKTLRYSREDIALFARLSGDENPLFINDPRFAPAGVLAPKSKADLAFIMHSLSWLASNGTAAIVCFPGIMYRGGAEQKIRKYLVDNNFVDAIIQLPSNLFLNVTISVDIMLLKKNKTDNAVPSACRKTHRHWRETTNDANDTNDLNDKGLTTLRTHPLSLKPLKSFVVSVV